MSVKFRTFSILQERKYYWCSLALCSLVSAMFGVFFTAIMDSSYLRLIYLAVCQPVSFWGIIASVLLPYVLFAILICKCYRWIVYALLGMRVFTFTAVSCCLNYLFPTGSWLVIVLFQFPDIIILPMLFLLSDSFEQNRRYRHLSTAIVLVVSLLYLFKVSPFLATLIDTNQTMGRYAFHVRFDWSL